jgi:uncharacterized membrane protein
MTLIGKYWLFFLSFGVAGYAVIAYGFLPLGSLVSPEMKVNFDNHVLFLYIHIFASIVALLLGPFQLSSRFRNRYKQLHQWMGRIYLLVGVLIGGLAALYISQFAFGGMTAKLGFAVLAVLWLYSGLRAYLAIRKGAIVEHQKWMFRNFALTFAAVTLRIYLPLSMVSGIEFSLAYSVIAWLCWIPNLIVVELFFNSKCHFAEDQNSTVKTPG